MITHIDEIVNNLFVADWYSSDDIPLLKQHKITCIITVETTEKSERILAQYRAHGITHYQIKIYDHPSEDIRPYLEPSFNCIRDHIARGGKVLVHCYAGVSRSISIILWYIIKLLYLNHLTGHLSPSEVVNYSLCLCRRHRPIANPNPGFMLQLVQAAEELAAINR